MENHLNNSRGSSRHSRSVVFPRIKTDQKHHDLARTGHESMEEDPGRMSSKSKNGDFNKYVLERLDFTERALETERRERAVLEDHVRGVTSHMQRLSRDMASLQLQLKPNGNNTQSSIALKNPEINQVSGIGDVWNRLTVGDLNTIKLSGDLNKLSGDVSDIKRNGEHLKEDNEKLSKDVQTVAAKVEKFGLESDKNLQMLKVELDSKVASLERSLEIAEKWNERLGKRNEWSDGNGYLKREMEDQYLQALKNFELRFDQFVEKQESFKEGLMKQLTDIDEELQKVKRANSINYEDLTGRMDELKTDQRKRLEKANNAIKDSYREAFRAVYESITTMQTVLEAKLKMTEADLKTSINSILKTISQ